MDRQHHARPPTARPDPFVARSDYAEAASAGRGIASWSTWRSRLVPPIKLIAACFAVVEVHWSHMCKLWLPQTARVLREVAVPSRPTRNRATPLARALIGLVVGNLEAAVLHPREAGSSGTKPDGSRPTAWNHPTSLSGDRGRSRTAISKWAEKAKLDGSALHQAVNR